MRAERLGSYSIVATLAGTPSLLRLKSMTTVLTLHAAALMAGGDATAVVAASLLAQRLEQRLLGLSAVVISAKSETVWQAPTGAGRFKVLYSHYLSLSNQSASHRKRGSRMR